MTQPIAPLPPFVWLNGALRPTPEAGVSPYDRGLLLGDGLYETVRLSAGRGFRVAEHLGRLARSAEWMGLAIETDPAIWTARFAELVRANGLAQSEARVRVTVTRGSGGHVAEGPGLAPTVLITADPLAADVDQREQAGIASWPVRMMRHPDFAHHKTIALTPSVLAHRVMRARGGDERDEPLFVHPEGWLLEGATSNVFVVRRDGQLCTPPLSRPLLPGITRAALLELRPDAVETDLTVEDLREAREAFCTRSTRGLSPLVRVERAPVGDGRPGPETLALRAAYAALVERELR